MASMGYQHLPQVIGIVGFGQVGAGVAALAAARGLHILWTADGGLPRSVARSAASAGVGVTSGASPADAGMTRLKRQLERIAKRSPELLGPDGIVPALARVEHRHSLEGLAEADFVFEAVPEDPRLKAAVFARLDETTRVQTILASGTSACSITKLGAATTRPHRVVGMRFMAPVTSSPLMELSKGMHTSNQTFLQAASLGEFLGKDVAPCQDRPGFLVFRMLMPMINEAFYAMMEGVGSPEDIDRSMKLGAAMALGPLRMADQIGLDTCLRVMQRLHSQMGDKYRPCPLLAQYVDGGLLGHKTGRGVFFHEPGTSLLDLQYSYRLPEVHHAHHHHHAPDHTHRQQQQQQQQQWGAAPDVEPPHQHPQPPLHVSDSFGVPDEAPSSAAVPSSSSGSGMSSSSSSQGSVGHHAGP